LGWFLTEHGGKRWGVDTDPRCRNMVQVEHMFWSAVVWYKHSSGRHFLAIRR
jgi:hypothetical protein